MTKVCPMMGPECACKSNNCKDCAWWHDDDKQCSMLSIAERIATLTKLTDAIDSENRWWMVR